MLLHKYMSDRPSVHVTKSNKNNRGSYFGEILRGKSQGYSWMQRLFISASSNEKSFVPTIISIRTIKLSHMLSYH